MNINLRQLRAFVSIGRLGSFTKAAAALHATQPALSAQIRELEEALGVKLFDRSTRSVTLTQAGEDLMPSVDTVLTDLSSVVARARDVVKRNTGRVTVAALPSLAATVMPKVIARMRDAHPGIVVVIRDALAERAIALLRADEADFALTSAPPPDRELTFTPLFADRMVAVLPHAHPLARAIDRFVRRILAVAGFFGRLRHAHVLFEQRFDCTCCRLTDDAVGRGGIAQVEKTSTLRGLAQQLAAAALAQFFGR